MQQVWTRLAKKKGWATAWKLLQVEWLSGHLSALADDH